MASDTNTVILVGRLVDSMELKYTKSQYPIGSFTIAVNRGVKNQDGTWSDRGSFFDCVLYGNSAANLQLYLYKGKQVAITGYLEQDRWEKDGQKYSRVKVIVTNLQLVGSRPEGSGQQQQPRRQQAPQPQQQMDERDWSQEGVGDYSYGGDEGIPESIPF